MKNSELARTTAKTAGRMLVAALERHGVERIFCVPGESYLEVLDALHDEGQIDLIVAKHGAAAACMAEADGKLTGRPGICMVAGGSGAAHASIGIHIAQQDGTPLIMFVGQTTHATHARTLSPDLHYPSVFGSMAKLVIEPSESNGMADAVAQAFHVATSGRPGPVVIALPDDLLRSETKSLEYSAPMNARILPADAEFQQLEALLQQAKKPLVIVGGSEWTANAVLQLDMFLSRWNLPVASSPGRQDVVNNDSRQYIGHLGLGMDSSLRQRFMDADLVLTIGTRIEDIAMGGHSLLDAPNAGQQLIYCFPDVPGFEPLYDPRLALNLTSSAVAAGLVRLKPHNACVWQSWTERARSDYEQFGALSSVSSTASGIDLAHVMAHLSTVLPAESILAHGTGAYSSWLHRYYRYKAPRTELTSSCGSMAYSLPAAVAAALRYVDRTVVCVVGDGNFMTCPQSLATAVEYGASLIVLVINSGMYGTVRMQQEKRYPGRVTGAQLMVHDYVAVAKSFGANAERVLTSAEFPDALGRARAGGGVCLIELVRDPLKMPQP